MKFAVSCIEPKKIVFEQEDKDLIVSMINDFRDSLDNDLNEASTDHVSWDATLGYLADAGSKQCAMKAQECHNAGQSMSTWSGMEECPDLKWMIKHSLNFWFECFLANQDNEDKYLYHRQFLAMIYIVFLFHRQSFEFDRNLVGCGATQHKSVDGENIFQFGCAFPFDKAPFYAKYSTVDEKFMKIEPVV